jgi:hypothetical protein
MLERLGIVWQRWLKIAAVIGNVQMIIILSVVYWTMVTMVALPLKLTADPLGLRPSNRYHWVQRHPTGDPLGSMRQQG